MYLCGIDSKLLQDYRESDGLRHCTKSSGQNALQPLPVCRGVCGRRSAHLHQLLHFQPGKLSYLRTEERVQKFKIHSTRCKDHTNASVWYLSYFHRKSCISNVCMGRSGTFLSGHTWYGWDIKFAVSFFFVIFSCTVTDFSAGAWLIGVKFYVAVRPHRGQVFSNFGGIAPGMAKSWASTGGHMSWHCWFKWNNYTRPDCKCSRKKNKNG